MRWKDPPLPSMLFSLDLLPPWVVAVVSPPQTKGLRVFESPHRGTTPTVATLPPIR
jgi:hypothetical protein